jgi:hypothetical protein
VLFVLMWCRWVKTAMGQGFADAVGVKTPPMELDFCVKGLLKQVRLNFVNDALVSSRCIYID